MDEIRIDGGTQPRVSIDENVATEYACLYRAGVTLPPVTVFYDGTTYWLADGFHRYLAATRINHDSIPAHIHRGTKRDAVLYSVGANTAHGLRRKNADKRKAVRTLLKDEEWSQWSNCEIAKRCGVSEHMVRLSRDNMAAHSPESRVPGSGCEVKCRRGDKAYKHKTRAKSRSKNTNRGSNSPGTGQHPGFAKNARMPRNPHGENGPVPMRAISLPLNNPKQAARSMRSVYGDDYMREVTAELVQIYPTPEGA